MTRYAEGTRVAPEKSRAEIETLFRKAGATRVMIDADDGGGVATLLIQLADRFFRFRVTRPTLDEARAERQKQKRRGHPKSGELERMVDDEWRRRWRVLLLVSKAKLELIASKESTAEREFMADLVMPGGRTLSEIAFPKIAAAYEAGPPRLGGGAGDEIEGEVL